MPSITGLELVEILKHNNIPNVVIGMSGDAENESHFCSAGVSRFLLKPFDSDDVAKLVDQIL